MGGPTLSTLGAAGGSPWLGVVQAIVALVAVCLLAWVVLRFLARRGFGGASPGTGRIRVLERRLLDARRAIYLVEVDRRTLLIGVGESGAPTLLATLGERESGGPESSGKFDLP